MKLRRATCWILLSTALVYASALRAQEAWGAAPQLSARQIAAILTRSERLLSQGHHLQALRASEPADQALFPGEGRSFVHLEELSDRARSLGWICVVRLRGAYDLYGERSSDPRAQLVQAEARLRELLPRNAAIHAARHAEALVALGDRMNDALATLRTLHEQAALSKPEGYAALVVAARAIADDELARTARAQCVKRAKGRAARVCPAANDSPRK